MKIDKIVDDIEQSYHDYPSIAKIDTIKQPDKDIILDILSRLQDIIFPGFFGRKNLKSDVVKYYLGDQIQIIYDDLKNQILLAFDYSEKHQSYTYHEKQAEAKKISLEFLKRIPSIREYLSTDAEATFDGDPAAVSIA